MLSLSTLSLLAVVSTLSFAFPHGTSADATGRLYTISKAVDASFASDHPALFSSITVAREHGKSKEPILIPQATEAALLPGLLNNRDAEDGDCSTAITVTTKLQVTVTVTADDLEAEETTVGAAESVVQEKQAYTTEQGTQITSSRQHGHKHTGISSAYKAASASASISRPSSGIKPSSARPSVLFSSIEPLSSLAAVQSSSSSAISRSTSLYSTVSSKSELEPDQAYTLPSILSDLPSVIVPSSSTVPPTTTAKAISLISIEDKGHRPASHVPTTAQTTTAKPVITSTVPVATSAITSTAPVVTSAITSTAPVATPSSSYSSGKGKRGLAYNDASLTGLFASSSKISWAYNWASSTSGLAGGIMFIPTLWGNTAAFTNSWQSNAQKAIASGSTHLFSFNEPDLSSQSNISPEAAATAYKTYLSDMFGGGSTKLCAPAVTNGGDATGLGWLKNFMAACPTCQIDCINVHWYGASISEFESHINDAITVANGKEIFVTEFALAGTPTVSASQSFLDDAMTFLDSSSAVTGYAYFMAAQGELVDGSGLSSLGKTYAS